MGIITFWYCARLAHLFCANIYILYGHYYILVLRLLTNHPPPPIAI